jgi:predicted O-methyltransferase YrrM
VKKWNEIGGYFLYQDLYNKAIGIIQDNDVVVEIGVWYGRSIIYLSQACKAQNKNVIICGIDTFTGNEHGVVQYADNGKEYIPKAPFIFNIYKRNLYECECDNIITIADDSSKSAKLFKDNSIKFCFIDGNHSHEQVTKDITAWYPKVISGGVIAGDDFQFNDVSAAVTEFAKTYELKTQIIGQGWWIEKP